MPSAAPFSVELFMRTWNIEKSPKFRIGEQQVINLAARHCDLLNFTMKSCLYQIKLIRK